MELELFEELKSAIRASGLTWEGLSRRSNVSAITISNWMTGKVKSPRFRTMVEIATCLGMVMNLGIYRPNVVSAPYRPSYRHQVRMAQWIGARRMTS